MTPIPPAPAAYDRADQQDVRREVERAISDLERPIAAYAVPAPADLLNGAPLRTLSNSSSATDVREVLATLINDLKTKGILG